MELSIKHYGRTGHNSSSIIELIIKGHTGTMCQDITDRNSRVDEDLIITLRDIADELEEQNRLISEENKK